MSELSELIEVLHRIPHLELKLKYDVPKMLEEIAKIQTYAPYQTNTLSQRKKYEDAWSGVCLNSRTGNMFDEMSEEHLVEESVAKRKPTEAATLCPYLWSAVVDLGATLYRSRVMRIAPKSSLSWHSHYKNHYQTSFLTFHLPIIVPNGFNYSVMSEEDFLKVQKDASWKPKIYSSQYVPGTVTMFNSYHYHNVFNTNTTEHRVSLMMYASPKNTATKQLLIDAVNEYNGPFID